VELVPHLDQKKSSIKVSEARFVWLVTLALCLITTLPYVVGHVRVVPDTLFSGVIEHSLDSNNYLAYDNQSAFGRWLFRNPMTSEPHSAVFFNLEWLLIGKLGAIFNVRVSEATGILRLVCLVLMCFGVYWLSSFFLQSVFARRIALVAIMSGGGFGWIATVHLLHIPLDSSYFIDLTNANLFPFYWALKLPHFLVSESLVVLGLCFFLRAEEGVRRVDYVLAGLFYMGAGACRPYDMLFAMTATVLYAVVQWYKGKRLRSRTTLRLVPVLMSMPLLGYYFWIFKIHPVFRWWSFPGNPAPSPGHLALGFGMSFLLILIAGWRLRSRSLSSSEQVLLCCFATASFLAYSHRLFHFSFQFATNILVPMVLIGLAGLEGWIREWTRRAKLGRRVIVTLLILNSFTSIALAGQVVVLAAKGDFRTDSKLVEAFGWLNRHSTANDIVLADFDLSSQIPDYTHDVVFCGYGNAVNVRQKFDLIAQFLDPRTSRESRAAFIRQTSARFVLLSPSEEDGLHLAKTRFLSQVFKNDAAVIFLVDASTAARPESTM
jgi:hypothetical protein